MKHLARLLLILLALAATCLAGDRPNILWVVSEDNDTFLGCYGDPLAHTPKDTFPPVAPGPVTIASIGGIVSLFWPLNQETDIAGYNLYRAEQENTPPEKWIKLNPQLHRTASFRDDRVQVGKQYFYQITAVDIYGNESARSATVSETVNP